MARVWPSEGQLSLGLKKEGLFTWAQEKDLSSGFRVLGNRSRAASHCGLS